MAKLKLDENLPPEAADLLREAGHDALTVYDQNIQGGDDPSLAKICRREGRALVTLDLDFANIRAYPPAEYPGLIVLRPRRFSKPRALKLVRQIILVLGQYPLDRHLWVVTTDKIRLRS